MQYVLWQILAALCVLLVQFPSTGVAAQHADSNTEAAVLKLYRDFERAYRTQDRDLLLSILSLSHTAPTNLKHIRKYGLKHYPDLRLEPISVVTQTKKAAIFGTHSRGNDSIYHDAYLFRLDGGVWKLADWQWTDKPVFRPLFLPPEKGRFLELGMQWNDAPGVRLTRLMPKGAQWEFRAVLDESYLYFSYESEESLPSEGSPLVVAEQRVASLGEYPVSSLPWVHVVVTERDGTVKVFDIGVGTTSTGHYRPQGASQTLAYTLTVLDQAGDDVFSAWAGSHDELIVPAAHTIAARIPLSGINASEQSTIKLEMDDSADYTISYAPLVVK